MKIILVDTNLVRSFLVIIFLILIMVHTLENNYFLMRTKLEYLRYTIGGGKGGGEGGQRGIETFWSIRTFWLKIVLVFT